MQTIYLVPHTHYDVAWAFTKEEYFEIASEILERAVSLLEKYDDFKFSWEQVYPLKLLEERNPKLWRRVREQVRKGKLEIVDGQYLMPDTMLPTGEVLVREIMLGKRYCMEKFGVDVKVAWCADSFGMNAQMPQIYRKSGYRWVAFRRGTKQEHSEFFWSGLDGTIILAHWMPLGYRAGLYLDRLEESYIELNKYATTPHILMPSGSGSVPPQEEVIEAVKRWNREHEESKMVIATPSQFFLAVEKEEESLRKGEIKRGELYDEDLVEVFPQVCSSRAWIVQEARKCEGLLNLAEWFSALAWILGLKYPEGKLRECWEKICFIAFHDIVTGCGIDEIYGEVREICSWLKENLTCILQEALKFITSRINTGGEAVVVFNSLPWKMKNWCEVEVKLDRWEEEPGLEYGGVEIETQMLSVERDTQGRIVSAKLGFLADIPPLGYRVYKVVPRRREPERKLTFKSGNEVENEFFRLKVDPHTGIVEVYDPKGRLVLRGNELHIENEVGDLYYHRHMFFELIKNESGGGIYYGTFKPHSFKVEEGPLKTRLILEEAYYCLRWPYRLFNKFPTKLYKHRVLEVVKEVTVYRDLPRIEFTTKIRNHYPNIRLRVMFDTLKQRMVYFRETQFGVVAEPTELFASLEKSGVPAGIPHFQSWFWYGDGTSGVTFMNRGIPGSEIRDSRVYLTLLRSVGMLSADGDAGPLIPTPDALELNRDYTFEYAVQHSEGDWKQSAAYRHGQEFHHLPLPVQANSKGNLPAEFSFIKISPKNLIISALKKAEETDELVLRFFETSGEEAEAEVELFCPIEKCYTANLLEREEAELKPEGSRIRVKVKPFEIVTLKLKLQPLNSSS